MKNVAASIHNRVSTLSQAYVKKYHPTVWKKLRTKAEQEYSSNQCRRTTVDDLEAILTPKPE